MGLVMNDYAFVWGITPLFGGNFGVIVVVFVIFIDKWLAVMGILHAIIRWFKEKRDGLGDGGEEK